MGRSHGGEVGWGGPPRGIKTEATSEARMCPPGLCLAVTLEEVRTHPTDTPLLAPISAGTTVQVTPQDLDSHDPTSSVVEVWRIVVTRAA